jgi:DNA-binding CsgD family transcriptional regulator
MNMILNEDERLRPDPGRSLYTAGAGWSPDAPAALRARPLEVPDVPPPPRTVFVPQAPPRSHSLTGQARARAKRGRPPGANPQPRRGNGRGQNWSRMANVTAEGILALRGEGLTIREIAERFGCSAPTVWQRMNDAQLTRPQKQVSTEHILELRAGGMKVLAIAAQTGLTRQGVSKRLRVHRASSEAAAATEAALKVCACGSVKYPSSAKCWRCAKPEKDRKRGARG